MVEIDAPRVEQQLLAGRLACPDCQEQLRPWGHGRRRKLRRKEEDIAVAPRRSRCRGCLRTHILLPLLGFLRRRDVAEVIGEALLRRAAGVSYRRLAKISQVPVETLRGWVTRFGERADLLRAHFSRLAYLLDPNLGAIEPAETPFGDALSAIVAAWEGATARFGKRPLWHFASGATGAKMINTSPLFPSLGVGGDDPLASPQAQSQEGKRWTTTAAKRSPCFVTRSSGRPPMRPCLPGSGERWSGRWQLGSTWG